MISGKMHKIMFTSKEQAELLEVERDSSPLGPLEVSGRTLVSLISPGTELAGYQGQNERASFPIGPGYSAVFEVEAVGGEVKDLKAGDHAFCMGPHQSFQRFPRDKMLPVPEGLSPEVATFARMMSVTMTTLTTTKARPPAKVVVMGLGLVGHLAARIFGLCGYEVIACDPDGSRRRVATASGMRNVFPRAPLDDPAVVGHVGLVIECSGHEQAALDGCKIVEKGGEVVLVGSPWIRKTDLLAHELLHTIFRRYVALRSGWEWELPLSPTDFRSGSIFGNLEAALRWLAEGRIQVDGLYTTVPPSKAQQAYQELLNKQGEYLTRVFEWAG